jgi:hypothetical protein
MLHTSSIQKEFSPHRRSGFHAWVLILALRSIIDIGTGHMEQTIKSGNPIELIQILMSVHRILMKFVMSKSNRETYQTFTVDRVDATMRRNILNVF